MGDAGCRLNLKHHSHDARSVSRNGMGGKPPIRDRSEAARKSRTADGKRGARALAWSCYGVPQAHRARGCDPLLSGVLDLAPGAPELHPARRHARGRALRRRRSPLALRRRGGRHPRRAADPGQDAGGRDRRDAGRHHLCAGCGERGGGRVHVRAHLRDRDRPHRRLPRRALARLRRGGHPHARARGALGGWPSNHGGCGERSGGARRQPRSQMAARSSLLRRPTPGARPARRTSSVVAALAALAPRLVRVARHGYSARLLDEPALTPAADHDPAFAAAVLAKVTRRLIPFMFVLYVVAYLDRINVGFAALQMRQDLGFTDTVYALGAGIFSIGYFLFDVPTNPTDHRVGARVWMARIMISWGVISAATMLVRGATSFYALRFLLGAAEAGFFPGLILYLTYWLQDTAQARAVSRVMTATAMAGVVGGP